MEKRGQMGWLIYACALCLGYSGCVASITVLMGMSSKEYFLLAAVCAVVSLLAVYLPMKLLANLFCLRPGCMEKKKKTLTASVITVLILGAVVIRCLFFMPAGALAAGSSESLRLNLALQALAVAFLVPAISLLSGWGCGLMAALSVAAGPSFSASVFMKEPQSFCLFLFSFILFLNVLLLKSKKRSFYFIRILASAAVCGVALVFSGQLFHVILIGAAYLIFISPNRKAANVCLYLSAAGISFLACMTAAAAGDGVYAGLFKEVLELLQNWLNNLTSRETNALLHSASVTDYCMTLPFYMLAFFGLLEMRECETGRMRVWILPLMLQILLDMISKAPLQEQGMRLVLLGVFAGYGITETLRAKEGVEMKWKKKAVIQTEEACAAEADVTVTGEGSLLSESRQVTGSLPVSGDKPGVKTALPKPGEYLANPLPVPKRHVKREMDYGFEPDPDQMFYDIPVDENDDFELK